MEVCGDAITVQMQAGAWAVDIVFSNRAGYTVPAGVKTAVEVFYTGAAKAAC